MKTWKKISYNQSLSNWVTDAILLWLFYLNSFKKLPCMPGDAHVHHSTSSCHICKCVPLNHFVYLAFSAVFFVELFPIGISTVFQGICSSHPPKAPTLFSRRYHCRILRNLSWQIWCLDIMLCCYPLLPGTRWVQHDHPKETWPVPSQEGFTPVFLCTLGYAGRWLF